MRSETIMGLTVWQYFDGRYVLGLPTRITTVGSQFFLTEEQLQELHLLTGTLLKCDGDYCPCWADGRATEAEEPSVGGRQT